MLFSNGFPVHTNFAYTPHITLQYQESATGTLPTVPSLPLNFDAMYLVLGDTRYPFQFGTKTSQGFIEAAVETATGYPYRSVDSETERNISSGVLGSDGSVWRMIPLWVKNKRNRPKDRRANRRRNATTSSTSVCACNTH